MKTFVIIFTVFDSYCEKFSLCRHTGSETVNISVFSKGFLSICFYLYFEQLRSRQFVSLVVHVPRNSSLLVLL